LLKVAGIEARDLSAMGPLSLKHPLPEAMIGLDPYSEGLRIEVGERGLNQLLSVPNLLAKHFGLPELENRFICSHIM
jgi:hypothetical protein